MRAPLLTLAAVLLAAAPAHAARPRVAKVTSPPALLVPGETFSITGRVENPTRRKHSVQLRFNLRGPGVKQTLGFTRLYTLPAGRSRHFSADLTVNGLDLAPAESGYVLRACVRGAGRQSCRAGRRHAFVPAGAQPEAATATPAPTGAATATSTPAAGATTTSTPAATATTVATPVAGTPGARSGGDTLFPDIGNGGYDAQHYDLDLDYVPSTKVLSGTATATLKTTQALSEFSLDLAPWLAVSAVRIDGAAAGFTRDDTHSKLIVTPAAAIPSGATVKVAVTYSGTEQPVIDPDNSQDGWIGDADGAIVVCEPIGALGWFPNNDIPSDKATFTLHMSVPAGWSVVATGTQSGSTWTETHPTAPYLFGLGIGKYDVATTGTFTTAIDSSFANKAAIKTDLDRTPSILDYYASYYGVPYPFDAMGGIVPRQNAGYSLEVQTKPIYAIGGGPDLETIAHENGHMYFGDDVTLAQWKDIWLNEGMTEFSAWLWTERQNSGQTLAQRYAANYTLSVSPTFWNVAPADPQTAAQIFDTDAMYTRGAMTMYGIQQIMGEADFRDLMQQWLTAHAYGNATTAQFVALVKAADLADQQRDGLPDRTARWTEFFRQWLSTSYTGVPLLGNKPSITKDNFDTYAL